MTLPTAPHQASATTPRQFWPILVGLIVVHGAVVARSEHRQYRLTSDGQRSRWARASLLGGDDLHAVLNDCQPDIGQARRHVRQATLVYGQHPDFPGGLRLMRAGPVHATADFVS